MTSSRALAAALLVACAVLGGFVLACGGSGKGSGARDAAADVQLDAAGDGEGGSAGVGVLTFSETPDGGGAFFAGFGQPPPPLPSTCNVLDAGACATVSCKTDGGAASDGGADAAIPVAPNPGTLTLSGGVFGSGAGIDPDTAGTYLYLVPGFLFSPGDRLGVAGAGAEIPRFPRQTVVVPPTIDLTAPTPAGGSISIPVTQPLTVSWTGGRSGFQVSFVATALFTTGGVASMTCLWDGAAGTATVPSGALRPLAASNALAAGLSWYQLGQTRFTAGRYDATLSVLVTQGSPAIFQ